MDIQSIEKYVISLPERRDRLEQVVKQLPYLFYKPDFNLIDGIKLNEPHKGIGQAHLKCISYAKALNLPYCIIIEDDLLFQAKEKTIPYVTNAFNNVPDDWDILLAGIYDGHPRKVDEYWAKVEQFCGLHFYCVNAKFYDKMLQYDGSRHIDFWLGQVAKGNYYVTNQFFAIQSEGYSDNVKKKVNYSDKLAHYKIL